MRTWSNPVQSCEENQLGQTYYSPNGRQTIPAPPISSAAKKSEETKKQLGITWDCKEPFKF
jgi:diketogulonate reductase-like aldo/keto reductase